MKQKVANYTVIIEKQKRTGTNVDCYTALVPLLGIATEADTLEEVESEIQSLIQFHLESLAEEQSEIPLEKEPSIIKRLQVHIPDNALIAS